MKKITIIAAVLCLAGVNISSAQVTSSAGFKARANYTNYRLKGLPGTDSKYGLGAGLGAFVKIEFGEYFALQPEVLINLNRSKLKSEGTAKQQYLGVEVPVYAIGQFDTGAGKIFVGAGPYASYGIMNKLKNGSTQNLYKKSSEGDTRMERLDYGAGALLGYQFRGGFMVNAGYQMGLRNTLKSSPSGVSMKTSGFSLGVGYKF